MPNEQALKSWVDALRSGDYLQGKRRLRDGSDNPRYCCLGVACDIYAKTGRGKWVDNYFEDERGNRDHINLPKAVADYFGITSSSAYFKIDRYHSSTLTNENDGGVPFAEIADIIESRPPELFEPNIATKYLADQPKAEN